MSLIKKLIQNYLDRVMVLLLIFILLLSALFYYLQKIDQNSTHFYHYKQMVEKIDLNNQQFEHIFMHSFRYLDNDSISKNIQSFEHELLLLKEDTLTKKFDKSIGKIFIDIQTQFQNQIELIEEFKTLNSRISGSVFYLYELSKDMKEEYHDDIKLERLVSNILFQINQVFLEMDFNIEKIEKYINILHAYLPSDENVDYFYMHVKQFMSDTIALNSVIQKEKHLYLTQSIFVMKKHLEDAYLASKKEENFIGIIFFSLAFILLIFLIKTYLNVLQNEKEVQYLAYHDTLTNLPNRVEFERYMNNLIARAKEDKKRFILLFIDIDRFKVINDTLGHDVGDEMLVVLAERICNVLGKENLLARIGGDEFVAIIETEKEREAIETFVSRIASAIRMPIQIRELSLSVTSSIGIAQYPENGEDKNSLLKHADSAMYHAKEKGRDTYAFYTEQLSIDIQRRLELEQELVHALKKREFSLEYQPQYRLDRDEICGVEALVRWKSSTLGSVSPEEFISVAEDTGLIIDLGYYVFEEACRTYMMWKKQGIDLHLIAINISSVQLRQPDALVQFKAIIDETGIDAKNIEIELTERYIMEYATEKLTILDDLRALGCRISIDDFGTGYSSMSYLKSLSIDTIKIDKSFVLDLPQNKHDAEVSKAIIALSQSLGYEVIAEGIETKAQENLLKSYQCDMGQGYYFAKPMKSDEIVTFYHKNSH